MTSKNAPRASVPYDEAMQPLLKEPDFVAHYLLAAVAEIAETPESLVSALSDVIRANASGSHCMKSFASIALMMEHLSSAQLLSLVDLMEEVFSPEVRSFYANHGTFQSLRELAGIIAQEGPLVFDGTEKASTPAPKGMTQAEAAIQRALPDLAESETYQQMHQAVATA